MRIFVLLWLILSTNLYANPMLVDRLTEIEAIDANRLFDQFLLVHGISMGDIVGNGNGDVVGNGNGDVVGNGNGDVVGNGGGIIEGTIQYLVKNLKYYVTQTIMHADASYPANLYEALNAIRDSLEMRDKPLEVVFVSGDERKMFFDGHDQQERAAKTGFSEDYPIFINLDLIYASEDMSREFLLGLLIHEVGHQVGYKSHSFLDFVGAEVVRAVNQRMLNLDTIAFGEDFLDLQYLNYDMKGAKAQLAVHYDEQVVYVNGWDHETFKYYCDGYWPIGFQYRNLSWDNYIDLIDNPDGTLATVSGIVQVNCAATRGGMDYRHLSVKIKIMLEDGKLNVVRKYVIPDNFVPIIQRIRNGEFKNK